MGEGEEVGFLKLLGFEVAGEQQGAEVVTGRSSWETDLPFQGLEEAVH